MQDLKEFFMGGVLFIVFSLLFEDPVAIWVFGLIITVVILLSRYFNQKHLINKIKVTKRGPDTLVVTKTNLKPRALSQEEIAAQRRLAELQRKKTEIKKEILSLLESFDFQQADYVYLKNRDFLGAQSNELKYEKHKAKLIWQYFRDTFVEEGLLDHPPDIEQAEVIGALGQNVLVQARAGSGKTATISAKVAFLCDKYAVKPEEILVLCFNSSAAKNMNKKIVELVPSFENAGTFHSWAYAIVKPERDSLLIDVKEGEFSPKEYSDFIKKLIEKFSAQNIKFKEEVYDFFREEDEELDEAISETRYFENEQDRYLYLRNKTYMTLKGVRVKSYGEKWIADFLFEHGIEFYYEQKLTWGNSDTFPYHPDFTIKVKDKKYILEHWGIDEKSKEKTVPKHWKINWHEYSKEMESKRKFFDANVQYNFLQTSIRDINYNLSYEEKRLGFENILKERLTSMGIKCEKLPKAELINNVWDQQIFSKMDTLVGQFIGWMQKLEWDKVDLQSELNKGGHNTKQKHFCNIGLAIYDEYLAELNKSGKIDFNMLVGQATHKIKTGAFDVSHFKYLLIDEFQDFSQLFQNLVDAIREKNPQCNLFCVGDSWQLINGFAGSDLEYFEQFRQKSKVKVITTCYRSDRAIVDYGNAFADKYQSVFDGQRSQYFRPDPGEVSVCDISKIRIENDIKSRDIDDEFKKSFRKLGKDGKEYLSDESYESARYLKQCFTIVKQNANKTFLFLCRNSKMNRMDWNSEFKGSLLKILEERNIQLLKVSDKEGSIKFKTMHSSKGLEADVVVLLDVSEKTIPSVHPSSELFEIFGRTPNKILDEEKRLFYVAITRAKDKLYIITNKHSRSEFIIDNARTSKGRKNIQVSFDLE